MSWHYARDARLESSTQLERHLGPEALEVPPEGGNRHRAARLPKMNGAVPLLKISVHLQGFPLRRVTHVVHRQVEVRAPEEGHGAERLTPTEDVSGRRLSHSLRHNPVLHPQLPAEAGIGPPR